MKCVGCGVELQYDAADEVGYSPKKEALYCQRCFRLRHYDDPVYSKRFGIDPRLVLQGIQNQEGVLVLVMDCFAIEESLEQPFFQEFSGREILLVLTKRDILPAKIEEEKIVKMVVKKIRSKKLPIQQVFFHSVKLNLGNEELINYLYQYPLGTNFILTGNGYFNRFSLSGYNLIFF